MPATINDQTVYISTGNPETFYNQSSLYKPGELGKKFTHTDGKRYQIVQVDTAVSATYSSTVANGLVYWSHRTLYQVVPTETDSANLALLAGVAGRSPGISAKGTYFAMQIGGLATLVYGGTNTAGAVGGAVIGKATTLSDADAVTAGTAPTSKVVGWITVAGTTTNATVGCYMCLDDGEVG